MVKENKEPSNTMHFSTFTAFHIQKYMEMVTSWMEKTAINCIIQDEGSLAVSR